MNHAFTLNDIRNNIKEYQESVKAIGILIARPNIQFVKEQILCDINYFYHRSGKYIDFFLPGYGAYWYGHYPDEQNICKVDGVNWSYSDKMFCIFIDELERQTKWKYKGETELIIINAVNGEFDFTNTFSIWLDSVVKDEAIYSVRTFMEDIIRTSRIKIETADLRNTALIQTIGTEALDYIIEKLPFESGKKIKKTKYFIKRNLS